MTTLYNITNHACDKWSFEQREDALKLADEIVDVGFPNVPTDAGEDEIINMTVEFVNELGLDPGDSAVVSGEMTFSHVLVDVLQGLGHACYAATTERISEKGKNGKTTRRYEFIRFREYPKTKAYDLNDLVLANVIGYSSHFAIAEASLSAETGDYENMSFVATETDDYVGYLGRLLLGIGAYKRTVSTEDADAYVSLPVFIIKKED